MPQGYAPAVYVSSTFYDLNQIRADLKSFLESLGLDPVLSEFKSFPINPDANTIQNCVDTVKNRADIMILIVGSRFGYQTDNGKSITNLEYLQAKVKGIPIYIFILKSILNTLPVWEKNRNSDFQNIVDSPKLFEFVSSLLSSKSNWVFPFESTEDIVNVLKHQLPYLFMEGLILRQKVNNYGLSGPLQDLNGNALKTLIEHPTGWEYLLFSQVLFDEINSYKNIRYDLKYGVNIGRHEKFDSPTEIFEWLHLQIEELEAIPTTLNKLISTALIEAFGPPGQPGSPEHIVYVARRIGDAYKGAIEWSLAFNRVEVPDIFKNLFTLAPIMSKNLIDEIENYSERLYNNLPNDINSALKNKEPKLLEYILKLTVPDLSDLELELGKIRHFYGLST